MTARLICRTKRGIRLAVCALWLSVAILAAGTADAQVAFSVPGGFYEEPVAVALTAGGGLTIRYTTDGTLPTAESALYTGPMMLSPELYSTRNLYLTPDAGTDEWNPPQSVSRVIVLRAAAFDTQGERQGEVTTQTFFVASLTGRNPTLPAVAIAIDPYALFDADTGIFSPSGYNPDDSYNTGNFNNHGRAWERRAHVEYYEPEGGGFALDMGVRVHGGNTRMTMQKSLKLYARQEYGEKRIRYPLFRSLPYDKYKRLVLKPFGASWSPAGVQDMLAQAMAAEMPFVSLASRPVTLYINGEYWGLYYLQESPDQHLVAQIDDVDEDSVNVIGSWKGLIENGTNARFNALTAWLESADLSDSAQYEYLCSQIDIGNFIDYHLFEAFIANCDWPANNMRCYQHGESRWRWIFYDGDACFGNAREDMAAVMTYDGEEQWPSSREATLCWRRLLQSPAFVERCGRRLLELSQTAFDYSVTGPLLQTIAEEVSDEVPYQTDRFGSPEGVRQWKRAVKEVDIFLKKRLSAYLDGMWEMLSPQGRDDIDFVAFPNPAVDKVYLRPVGDMAGWLPLYVYDELGNPVMMSMVYIHPDAEVIEVDVSALPSGIYLFRMSPAGKARKVIKF